MFRGPAEARPPADCATALSSALLLLPAPRARARGRAARRPLSNKLSLAQSRLLEPLADGRPAKQQYAEQAGVSSPTATRMVDLLVRRRLVTRLEDPVDRRAVLISLTPAGPRPGGEAPRVRRAPPADRRRTRARRAARGRGSAAPPGGRDRGAVSETRPGYLLPHRATVAAIGGVLLGMMLAILNQTIVATALPRVAQDLGGLAHYSWVFSSYMLRRPSPFRSTAGCRTRMGGGRSSWLGSCSSWPARSWAARPTR